jgi:Fe-S-cluster formation regulator IscX/YfhJ
MKSIPFSCQTLMQIESSKYVFEKASNIKFINISPIGVKLCHANRHIDVQTSRPTDVWKLIIAFRNFAKTPNKNYNDATACPSLGRRAQQYDI